MPDSPKRDIYSIAAGMQGFTDAIDIALKEESGVTAESIESMIFDVVVEVLSGRKEIAEAILLRRTRRASERIHCIAGKKVVTELDGA